MMIVVSDMKLRDLSKVARAKVNCCFKSITLLFFITWLILSFPYQAIAINKNEGESIFIAHCSGCHINGGNIIRRNKTLKAKDLKRNGIDNPEAIALIARDGTGIMSGYKDVLSKEEDKIVANWILEQSQNAWIHG